MLDEVERAGDARSVRPAGILDRRETDGAWPTAP